MSRTGPIASALGLAVVLVALAVLASRVASVRPPLQAEAAAGAFERTRAAARLLIDEAAARGHLWLDTRHWLREATQAHRAGDEAAALALARRASAEARLAIEQARHEALRYERMRTASGP